MTWFAMILSEPRLRTEIYTMSCPTSSNHRRMREMYSLNHCKNSKNSRLMHMPCTDYSAPLEKSPFLIPLEHCFERIIPAKQSSPCPYNVDMVCLYMYNITHLPKDSISKNATAPAKPAAPLEPFAGYSTPPRDFYGRNTLASYSPSTTLPKKSCAKSTPTKNSKKNNLHYFSELSAVSSCQSCAQ